MVYPKPRTVLRSRSLSTFFVCLPLFYFLGTWLAALPQPRASRFRSPLALALFSVCAVSASSSRWTGWRPPSRLSPPPIPLLLALHLRGWAYTTGSCRPDTAAGQEQSNKTVHVCISARRALSNPRCTFSSCPCPSQRLPAPFFVFRPRLVPLPFPHRCDGVALSRRGDAGWHCGCGCGHCAVVRPVHGRLWRRAQHAPRPALAGMFYFFFLPTSEAAQRKRLRK